MESINKTFKFLYIEPIIEYSNNFDENEKSFDEYNSKSIQDLSKSVILDKPEC